MDKLVDGWFSESDCLWQGQKMSYQVDRVLYRDRSAFQDVLVFHHLRYGNVLALDDIVQCTEMDEFAYQEMMVHVPLLCYDPSSSGLQVLVIGGGDGGVVREIVKHGHVAQCTLCEIDSTVIDVSKRFFPLMAVGLKSEKLTIHIGDGFDFLKSHIEQFDVIITDCSDEKGPGEFLFNEPYFELVKNSLKPNGIHVTHDNGPMLEMSESFPRLRFSQNVFPSSQYYYISSPSYPSGELGFVISGKSPNMKFDFPLKELSDNEVRSMKLRYYNSQVHKAAFVLPQFTKERLPTNKL
ncbi:spermidine synthase-like [Oscarella lobularis]|uniref:spermidine synthase-like n=1 Tax=Oscarella lobularis TaxID=121494 RepID=UPI0033131EC4